MRSAAVAAHEPPVDQPVMNEPIRVLIVDDDALVHAALTMLLAGAEDIAVVGEAKDGSEVMDAVAAAGPDIVLMDIRMPTMDGLARTGQPGTAAAAQRTLG